MKQRKKYFITLLLLSFCLVFSACSVKGGSSAPSEAGDALSSGSSSESMDSESMEIPGMTSGDKESKTATLYVGQEPNFTEYGLQYEGDLTPEVLIAGIASLTGWNLDLALPVTVGQNGFTVFFSKDSALLQGPPDPQKDEFFMYDVDSLVFTILDSVRKTLQSNPVDTDLELPAQPGVWYGLGEDREALSIPDMGFTLPLDQEYPGSDSEKISGYYQTGESSAVAAG